MKVLVLYSRLTSYWMACMQTARNTYQTEFLVYRQKPAAEAPFELESEEGIIIKDRELLQNEEEKAEISFFSPNLVYVAGWNHKGYLQLAKTFRARNISIVGGMDNHWQGSAKQYLATIFAPFYLKQYFDYLWVPGAWQFAYALKLGFSKEQILTSLYSADVEKFRNSNPSTRKRFLFVGRLVHHKGIDILLNAFTEFCKEEQSWELLVVGNGEEKIVAEIRETPNTVHIPFIAPDKLRELFHQGGTFVLPSRYEAWGVVIHEAVACGLPVIASTECGATASFVKDYYNGYIVKPKTGALLSAMRRIASHEQEVLRQMAQRSFELSLSISPAIWAAQLNSVFNKVNRTKKGR